MTEIEKLEESINEQVSKLAKLKEEESKPKFIDIPDSIQFEKDWGEGDELGIVFNESKQTLYYRKEVYSVAPTFKEDTTPCHLIAKPVTQEEVMKDVGGTYLRRDNLKAMSLSHFCKILPDNGYVFVERGSISLAFEKWKQWHKVVKK